MFKDMMILNLVVGGIVLTLAIVAMVLALSAKKSFLKKYEFLSIVVTILIVLAFPREGIFSAIVIIIAVLAFITKIYFLYCKYQRNQKKQYTSNVLMFDTIFYAVSGMIVIFEELAKLLA